MIKANVTIEPDDLLALGLVDAKHDHGDRAQVSTGNAVDGGCIALYASPDKLDAIGKHFADLAAALRARRAEATLGRALGEVRPRCGEYDPNGRRCDLNLGHDDAHALYQVDRYPWPVYTWPQTAAV